MALLVKRECSDQWDDTQQSGGAFALWESAFRGTLNRMGTVLLGAAPGCTAPHGRG
jgi:hypothetical protein